MYLSNSGAVKADACLFDYWNEYINKTPVGPDDRLGSIFGTSYGLLFEQFYEEKMWRLSSPKAELLSRVERVVDETIKKETTPSRGRPGGLIKWKGEGPDENPKALYASRDELIADVKDHIPNGLASIRKHLLVGPRTEAEVKLDYRFDNGIILAGRADFIIKRLAPHNDLLIVDGKGSKHRDKYVKPRQLIWYSMLFNLHAAKNGGPPLPDKTAFLFWKFPPESNLDIVDVSQDDVDSLLEETFDMIRQIESLKKKLPTNPTIEMARGVFTPKPSRDACQYCKYKAQCPAGTRYMEKVENEYTRKR